MEKGVIERDIPLPITTELIEMWGFTSEVPEIILKTIKKWLSKTYYEEDE